MRLISAAVLLLVASHTIANAQADAAPSEQNELGSDSSSPPTLEGEMADRPTPTQTWLTAIAKIDISKNPTLQLSDEIIEQTRHAIETAQELSERYKIAADNSLRNATALNKLKRDTNLLLTPEEAKTVDDAYRNVLAYDAEKKARSALEEKAIENIRLVASRDPVQAQHIVAMRKQAIMDAKAIEAEKYESTFLPILLVIVILGALGIASYFVLRVPALSRSSPAENDSQEDVA